MDQIDVMFTGHRPPKLGGYDEENPTARKIKKWLETQVGMLVLTGNCTFVSGAALGTDQWGAEAVIETRKAYPHIKLVMAVPCDGYSGSWPDESKKRFQGILDVADEVNIVCPGEYKAYKNIIRDQWMVDRASRCVAVFDGTKGGTAHTVKMAKKKGIPVVRLDPRLVASPEGTRVRLLKDDSLKRWTNGELGEILPNDSEKYDLKLRLTGEMGGDLGFCEVKNAPRVCYSYYEEVEIAR